MKIKEDTIYLHRHGYYTKVLKIINNTTVEVALATWDRRHGWEQIKGLTDIMQARDLIKEMGKEGPQWATAK